MVTKATKNDVKIKQMGKPLSTYPPYFQNIIHFFLPGSILPPPSKTKKSETRYSALYA